jgi:hypothetical protein
MTTASAQVSDIPDHIPSSDSGGVDKNFTRLKNSVLAKKPIFAEIIADHGRKDLFSYARGYTDVNINPAIKRRQVEFIKALAAEADRLLGAAIARSVAAQLTKYYYVSTADHHGPICHPFFINSNLLAAAPYPEFSDPVLQNVIVLSCANISLDNSSYPRGLMFNTFTADTTHLNYLPFVADYSRVHNFPAYAESNVQKVKKLLRQKVKAGLVPTAVADEVNGIIDEIYNTPEILSCRTFSDQITKTNFRLWQKFFAAPQVKLPNLIYIEQEHLVSRLLSDHHLDQETAINKILFDQEYWPLVDRCFDGIMGAFSYQAKWGTYLFWAISPERNHRVQLWRQGDKLVSTDGRFSFDLTPSAIKEAIAKEAIVPSLLLIGIVLACYYGLKCLGGFSQVNYLTFMKNAYIKMMAEKGRHREIEVCVRVQTKELGGDMSLAFLQTPDGKLTPATGLDLILYGTDKTWPQFVALTKSISVAEALDPMMPELYNIVYPKNERTEAWAGISPDEITIFTGLDKKIKPCVEI